MSGILKGLQSVLIALGIIGIIGTGTILYYNTIAPGQEDETAAAETATSDSEIPVEVLTADTPETESAETEDEANPPSTDALPVSTAQTVAPDGHAHNYKASILKDATCTEAGQMKYTCGYCEDYYIDVIAPLDHTPGDWRTVKEATSTATGLRQKACTMCGRVLQEEVIPALASSANTNTKSTSGTNNTTDHKHSYTYEITEEPTCTENGEKTYTCSICGNTFKTKIAASNHSSRKTIITDGDCGNPGKVEITCAVCNAVISSETLSYDHKFSSWQVTTEPTTTSTGVKTRTCKVCGKEETKTVSKLSGGSSSGGSSSGGSSSGGSSSGGSNSGTSDHTHSYTSSITTPASCTSAGVTTYTCSQCSNNYTEAAPAALGHNPGNWTTVKEPTTTAEGKRVKYCRRCGEVAEEEVLAKLPEVHVHSFNMTITKEPGCTTTGTRKYTCPECGYYYTTSIKATGHSPQTSTDANGNPVTVCKNCGQLL